MPSFTKNTSPLITIITVCLNAEAHLETTIQSVAGQTYPFIEYIIIDGVSTDGTLDLIKKHEKNITKWVSEKDSGIYDAMNKGVKMAKGESILMLNAGDFLQSNAIAQMVQNANGQIHNKIICCDWIVFFTNTTKKIYRQATFDFNQKNGICHQGTLIGRDIYRTFGNYDTTYRFVSDYEFYVRVWTKSPEVFVRTPYYLANFMYEGFTTKGIRKSNIERWRVIEHYFSWSKSWYLRLVTLGAIIVRTFKAIGS
jgi:glycosyltransferase involved in cell wall biosynthesis